MSDAPQGGFKDVFGGGRGKTTSRHLDLLTVYTEGVTPFTFRVVYEGDTYGLDQCLAHSKREPLVECYDAAFADDDRFEPWGQFTGGRWNITQLLNDPEPTGLAMDYGVPAWRIDAAAHRQLLAWLQQVTW